MALSSIFDKISVKLGSRSALLRELHNLSLPQVSSLDENSVFWGQNLRIEEIQPALISHRRDGLEFREQLASLLSELFVKTEIVNTDVPLTKLSGFYGSKSSGSWQDLPEFAAHIQKTYKPNSHCDLKCDTVEEFDNSIQHCFPKRGAPFKITYCMWDKKYFWNNVNGSHHLGAAYGYALRTGVDYLIPATLTRWSINDGAAHLFNQCFTGIIVTPDCFALENVLKKFGVPYQWAPFVPPFSNYRVLFIPNDARPQTILMIQDNLISKGTAHSFGKLIAVLSSQQKMQKIK